VSSLAAALQESCQEGLQEALREGTSPIASEVASEVAHEARTGLTASPRTLAPWLFYDEQGSRLFEQITALPEYYLTRTERALFEIHADEIFLDLAANLTLAELGAGTAAKTGILLRALACFQPEVLYQPIDISPTALEAARETLERTLPAVTVCPQVANYITGAFTLHRPADTRILALYIGSSIGNFLPAQARAILTNLRTQLVPGDALLLGADLAPSLAKPVDTVLAAYDDAAGVTAAFNRNILARLNRDLGANFDLAAFRHVARWNPADSRIEMHLESLRSQTVLIPANAAGPALTLAFAPGETIHTENSTKFSHAALESLLLDSGFVLDRLFTDPGQLFAVALARVA
jgi:L-histidine N-alpha-methyltransferase